MPLHAQEVYTDLHQIVRAKITAGEYLALSRQDFDLVLMAHHQVEARLPGLHPLGPGLNPVERYAYAPATLALHHFTTKGLGHKLVTKADTHQRLARLPQLAYEITQRLDPGQLIVDTMLGAGRHPHIHCLDIVRNLAILTTPYAKLQSRLDPLEQGFEHGRVIAVNLAQLRRHVIAL